MKACSCVLDLVVLLHHLEQEPFTALVITDAASRHELPLSLNRLLRRPVQQHTNQFLYQKFLITNGTQRHSNLDNGETTTRTHPHDLRLFAHA